MRHNILHRIYNLTHRIYVDDIIVKGNDEKERQTLRQCLSKEFELKCWEVDIFPRN